MLTIAVLTIYQPLAASQRRQLVQFLNVVACELEKGEHALTQGSALHCLDYQEV